MLSRHERGESSVWLNQMVPDVSHAKRGNLWRNFLAGLGAGYGNTSQKETNGESIYQDGLCCLWKEEDGSVIAQGQILPKNVRVGCKVYSPQERTNFLYNPDMVHLEIQGEESMTVYLNGNCLGEGKELRFTSIGLKAGENQIVLVSSEEQGFPKIRFERANGKPLDLEFGK